jgi:hypothetical protein
LDGSFSLPISLQPLRQGIEFPCKHFREIVTSRCSTTVFWLPAAGVGGFSLTFPGPQGNRARLADELFPADPLGHKMPQNTGI